MTDSLYKYYIGQCPLPVAYLIYRTFWNWLYSCLQVTCHYTNSFIIIFSLYQWEHLGSNSEPFEY